MTKVSLPEPQNSLIQTICKVYGVSKTDPVFYELLSLHMALNLDVFAAHQPLTKRVIYLADIQINRSVHYAGLSKSLLESLQRDIAGLKGTKANLEKIVPRAPAEVETMRYVLGFNEVMGRVGTALGPPSDFYSKAAPKRPCLQGFPKLCIPTPSPSVRQSESRM